MQFNALSIAGAYQITLDPKCDERGSFTRVFDAELFNEQGLHSDFPQHSISKSAKRGTLRGMHYQQEPYGEIKLIQCVQGRIFDVMVDLRKDSPSYLQQSSTILSADKAELLYVPAGCAHAILTLEDDSYLHYLISTPYIAQAQTGLRWNDPALDIAWPEEVKVISERDANWPLLEQ